MRGCAYGLETVTTPGSTRATSPSVPPRGPMTGPGARRCARSAPSCDARTPALGDRRRIPGGRLAVLRRRPPHLACGAVVRSRAYRALGAVAGRRYVRRPVRRYADGEAAAGVPRGG